MLLATKEQVNQANSEFFPSPSWVRAAMEEYKYTPDMAMLFRQQNHILFTYGEEQPGHPKSIGLIGIRPSAWTGYTMIRFACYKHRLSYMSHPLAFDQYDPFSSYHNYALRLHLKGRLVPVNTNRLLILDKYRQNGIMYDRREVRVTVPYLEWKHNQSIRRWYIARAWMYVARPDFWDGELDAGFDYPVLGSSKHWNSALNPHYHFSLSDYDAASSFEETVDNDKLYREYLEQVNRKTKVPRVRQGRQGRQRG